MTPSAPQIIPRINILLDQMNLCEKIRSKCLNLQRIASIFNQNQRDRLGSKSVTFPHLDHSIWIINEWLGYQKASISFSEDNVRHFLWIYCIVCDVKRHEMWRLVNMKIWVNFSCWFSKIGPRQMIQQKRLICFDT